MLAKDAPSRAQRKAKSGDVVISTVRTYLRAIGKVLPEHEAAIFSTGFAIVRSSKEITPSFLYYALLSEYFLSEVEARSNGISYPAINASDLLKINIAVPLLEEQIKLTQLLDRETTRIDALVSKKTRFIELLREKRQALITQAVTRGLNPNAKLKDSGVEWLGKVPEHWEVKQIKYLSTLISKGTTPTTINAKFTSEGVRFIKAENISDGKVLAQPEFYIAEDAHATLARSDLQENDVLVVIAGATTGKSAILNKNLLPANTNQAVSFIRPTDKRFSKYIDLWLNTNIVKSYVLLNSVQSAQPNLSMEDLGNIPIPFPPLTELLKIIEFLDRETTRIDALISKTQHSINLLKERRAALITAAVTGQIDVRYNSSTNTKP